MKSQNGHTKRHPLFEILDTRGLRRDWFAAQVGIRKDLLSHIEHGRRRFPPQFRARAAETLGVPESLLFSDQADSKESA